MAGMKSGKLVTKANGKQTKKKKNESKTTTRGRQQ